MKGLSFSEPMVKAWLAGNKSVTRRLMNPQPDIPNIKPEYADKPKEFRKQAYLGPQHLSHDPNMWCLFNVGDPYGAVPYLGRKPRYLPGETVYIKEAWCGQTNIFGQVNMERTPFYKADGEGKPSFGHSWKSPLFMPEWAARSHARIVSVRPERVQEITEEEARREGVTPFRNDPEGDCWTNGKYRTAFEYLWNELHGWDPNSFQENPWVWREELEKKP